MKSPKWGLLPLLPLPFSTRTSPFRRFLSIIPLITLKTDYQLTTDIDTPGVLQRLSAATLEKESRKTDMDAAALFENTVLHEMTHSKVVGIPQWDMGIGEVYGWLGNVDFTSPDNPGM